MQPYYSFTAQLYLLSEELGLIVVALVVHTVIVSLHRPAGQVEAKPLPREPQQQHDKQAPHSLSA